MKGKRVFLSGIAVLLLILAVGLVQAQGSQPPADDVNLDGVITAESALDDGIFIQGRLMNSSGTPINGSVHIKASLYSASSGGTALCTDTDIVNVSSGLFTMRMDYCNNNDIDGQQLWMGITVGSDPEMTPRQPIYAVPYARSLRPGAVIDGSNTITILNVVNHGSGQGVSAYSREHDAIYGHSDANNHAGVSGVNTNGGIGAYGYSNSGPALSLGGTGSIKSTARTYIFVPGNAFVKNKDSDTTRWSMSGGSAKIYRGSVGVTKLSVSPSPSPPCSTASG